MRTNEHVFTCHRISGDDVVEGKALISPEAICFYMVEAETGVISEKGHALEGQSLKDRIVIMPNGKGSSVVQDEGFFAMKKNNSGPKAIIVKAPDTVLVAGTIVMGYPLIDRVESDFYELIENGDIVRVDCNKEIVVIHK
ncbi:MAG: DUF126 domain-containing protein [Deltaproteobacteria bacterium]|nr:DUF126 domain-containing protein [Deltaproteobacteria bacterium]